MDRLLPPRTAVSCPSPSCRDCLVAPLLEVSDPPVRVETFYLPEGYSLYRYAEEGQHFYRLLDGRLKLYRTLADGRQRILRLLGPGELLGLETLLSMPYQHHAQVLRSAVVCRLPASAVTRHSLRHPGLGWQLLGHWQRALEMADTWLTQFATGTARQRVARLLLWLADGERRRLEIAFTREEMGAMLALTTETVSRVMAELQRAGTIRTESESVMRCDLVRLRQLSGES